MADNKNQTIFQKLGGILMGTQSSTVNNYSTPAFRGNTVDDKVLYSTNDKDDYERKLTQLRQQKLLNYQWLKAGVDTTAESIAGYTAIKLMYRDADLMDGTPEIGAALDIIEEEVCTPTSDGSILSIYSKSKRIKSILEDLFINRLNIHIMLPMIVRDMCKYGNCFMLLNVDEKNGVLGWKKLPVYEIDRVENGFSSKYSAPSVGNYNSVNNTDEVSFIWNGHNESMPYKSFQMAHFRLLNDSFFLPYGVSILHKARRAWRMWSMMEDSMLIYRLDKSIERRVFKIFVGGIDENDVKAYVEQIANNFKRTPIVDPQTGQVDLRKNFLDVSSDYFIPVRTENAATPIETLQSATWAQQTDDIDYMQNKIFAALRIPKTFLNFQDAQGKGQNLGFVDIRFSRMITRIQQFVISELNKIAMTHLYLLGMGDDVTNFSIMMNNSSTQVESQEIDMLTKKASLASQLLADPGIGVPLYSLHKTLKDVMNMSDAEIIDMMNEIRLEKAMAAELASTQNVIKKTGLFDKTDRIYGDFDALYGQGQQQQAQAPDAGPGGGGFGGGAPIGGGGGLPPIGDMGAEEGDMGGVEGDVDMSAAGDVDAGAEMQPSDGGAPAPTDDNNQPSEPLQEHKKIKSFVEQYLDMLAEKSKDKEIDDVNDLDLFNSDKKMEQVFSRIDEITNLEV